MASVANLTGVKNHATVLNSKSRVANIVETSRIDRNIYESLTQYINNAASSILNTIVRNVSVTFNVAPIKILNPSLLGTIDYDARSAAIWLMQSVNKLNVKQLAI